MHIAVIPNRNSPPTYLLRETYREDGKVKHHTVGNITSLGVEKISLIEAVLKNQKLAPIDQAFHIQKSSPHGHIEAILNAIRFLKLDKIIDTKPSPQRSLVLAMIAQRIINPLSKLGTTRVWDNTTLAQELRIPNDTDQDDLYDAMDWLLKRQSKIEKKLAARHLEKNSLALYDISSSYFEGEKCPLAKFGHNRDEKKNKKIVVYGLLTDADGRPVHIKAWPGNTNDSTTVPDTVKTIRQEFGLDEIILVGDRGMLTGVQIEKLKEYPGVKYISALRGSSLRKLVDDACFPRSLLDEKHLAEFAHEDYPGERLIACHNPLLESRRHKVREELLCATEKKLDSLVKTFSRMASNGKPKSDAEIGVKVGQVINSYNMKKHFTYGIKEGVFTYKRNEESIREESELDGMYVIRTSVASGVKSAENVVRDYKRLGEVEKSFRTMKTTLLETRPIYHWREERVRSHLLICMLAYYVTWHLRSVWSEFLYSEESMGEQRATRYPVIPAKARDKAQSKKVSKERFCTESGVAYRIESFRTLLDRLSSRSRNFCRMDGRIADTEFEMVTSPDGLQGELLSRVEVLRTRYS